MACNVQLYYMYFKEALPTDISERYEDLLPAREQERINRFHRWEDKTASLLGKALLLHALRDAHIADLKDLQYTAYKRPYLEGVPDFNISHSGHYVVCALVEQARVGIDIEQVRQVTITDFTAVLSPAEQLALESSAQPSLDFYDIWTQKEAIIKGDGRGVYLPLKELDTKGASLVTDEHVWMLRRVDIDPEYRLYIACNKDIDNITVQQVSLQALDVYTPSATPKTFSDKLLNP